MPVFGALVLQASGKFISSLLVPGLSYSSCHSLVFEFYHCSAMTEVVKQKLTMEFMRITLKHREKITYLLVRHEDNVQNMREEP
jgi:hypothetical protein